MTSTATATETEIEQLADRYLAAWNETDTVARLDPLLTGAGHANIHAIMTDT